MRSGSIVATKKDGQMSSLVDPLHQAYLMKRCARPSILVSICLALCAGCVTTLNTRSVDRANADAPSQPRDQAKPAVALSARAGAPDPPGHGDASKQASAPPGQVPNQATPTAAPPRGIQDPSVAKTANADQVVVPSPSVIPPPEGEYPLDLSTALRLADVANPTIAAARTMILEALALQTSARVLLVPSLNAGVSYHGHNGNLQRSAGRILNLSQQSLLIGAGARTISAESIGIPGILIYSQLTDAWFEPLAARQRVTGARSHAQATTNDILLDVAVLHLELLGNQAILDAQRLSESQVYEIVHTTNEFFMIGQGRKADADRALAEWRRRRALVQKAEEEVGVSAARLANRLNLDPAVRLHPVGGPIIPLELVSLESTPQELIQVALRQRPDLVERTAQIGEVDAHRKQEIARPLLPSLWMGFSGAAFGGGSNLSTPLMGNFAGRTDFDVRLYWTLLNFGGGNLSLIRRREAEVGQAVAERQRMINRVRDEVSASLGQARAARNEIDIARRELASATAGFREDLELSRNNLDRPIEVINNLELLADARVNLIRALVDYDQAQFRLWVALGSPPPLAEPAEIQPPAAPPGP
jgi:outer membrane protein TolC